MATSEPAPPMQTQEITLDDADVIDAVRRGEREQFAILVRRYNQRLYRVGIGYLRRPDLVEDAMQNAYLHAFTRLYQYSGRSAFSTWLTRIMINECLMQLRHMRILGHYAEAAEHDPTVVRIDLPRATANLQAEDVRRVLEQAVAELPQPHKIVYLLRDVQQLTIEETADVLGIRPENVKVRLHRAREMLKNLLLASAAGSELFTYDATRCVPMTERVMRRIAAV